MLDSLRMFLYGLDPAPHRRGRPWRFGQLMFPLLAPAVALMSYAFLEDNLQPLTAVELWLVSIGTGLPLLFLPRYPLMAFRIAYVLAIVTGLRWWVDTGTPWPWQPAQVLEFPVLLYLVSVRHRRPVLFGVFALMGLLIAGFAIRQEAMGLLAAVAVIMVLGDQVRRRREAQARLIAEAERTQLESARRTIAEERTRIAREMHDVVAHHMSLIAVRAETAPFRLGGLAEDTAAEFTGIAGTAREALVEMRRLLGVLRQDDPALETAPQPGLDDVPGLVEAARAAGVTVALDLPEGAPHAPPGVQLSAYRIVQEALSNATRHAPGATVSVALSTDRRAVRLAVVNGAPRRAPDAEPRPVDGAHHGLVGMRERAAVHGGTLVAEPTADGGFQVHATLPLDGRVEDSGEAR